MARLPRPAGALIRLQGIWARGYWGCLSRWPLEVQGGGLQQRCTEAKWHGDVMGLPRSGGWVLTVPVVGWGSQWVRGWRSWRLARVNDRCGLRLRWRDREREALYRGGVTGGLGYNGGVGTTKSGGRR
ncbi:unnamed protein product [Sphenostylis stenocarpa]|uniref:Uncharacterized protein n=1 Tax=Sphenostylis stenocarpa TaxID=92480 RepID=A0AA86VFZ0_9FABA|nr:unnamed protein product [Sphenostylis stenocarpa]